MSLLFILLPWLSIMNYELLWSINKNKDYGGLFNYHIHIYIYIYIYIGQQRFVLISVSFS